MGNYIFEAIKAPQNVSNSVRSEDGGDGSGVQKPGFGAGLVVRVAGFWRFIFKASLLPVFSFYKCVDYHFSGVIHFVKHNSLSKILRESYIVTYIQHLFTTPLCLSSIADAVLQFPSSIIVPYRSINSNNWLHDNDHGIVHYTGYVPIHPNDVINLLNPPSKLCYRMMYASR